MRKIHSLQTLQNFVRHRRERAMQLLVHATVRLEHAVSRLRDLQGYLLESEFKWISMSADCRDPGVWGEMSGFTNKLTQAIEQQKKHVGDCEHAVALARQELMAMDRQQQSLSVLGEKRLQQEAVAQHRLDQRNTDELASALSLRRTSRFRPEVCQ